MIVAGTLTNKMAPSLRKVYDQVLSLLSRGTVVASADQLFLVDARAPLGHLDGIVRQRRRLLPLLVLGRPRLRPDRPRRPLRSWMPAHRRGTAVSLSSRLGSACAVHGYGIYASQRWSDAARSWIYAGSVARVQQPSRGGSLGEFFVKGPGCDGRDGRKKILYAERGGGVLPRKNGPADPKTRSQHRRRASQASSHTPE